GQVSAVRVAPEQLAPPSASGVRTARSLGADQPAATGGRRRISEHDPLWHEAVIEVASVEKGAHSRRQVVVRFPGSNDVAWRAFPKFTPGQRGVWMLRQEEGGGVAPVTSRGARARSARRAAATAAKGTPAGAARYVAPEQPAFQPIEQVELVRDLLR